MVLVNGATEFAGNFPVIVEGCRDCIRMSTRNSIHAVKGQACVREGNAEKKNEDWLKELHCSSEMVVCGD